MKIDLEVIAATSIKRRKPWPHIAWVGKKSASLLLVDKRRVSVLYIPSGKTKPKVPQLSNAMASAVCTAVTPGGGDLVGVLENGEVFVWNKDNEKLRTVYDLGTALGRESLSPGSCQVFASEDCNKILVAVDRRQLFLWQHDTSNTYLAGEDRTLLGRWTRVVVADGMMVPGHNCPEACLHAVFTASQSLGDCCSVSMVFNADAVLTISSVLIRFEPPDPSRDNAYPSLHYQWKCLQYPLRNISAGCEALSIGGAYVARSSPDGSLLAVAVNQKSPADTSLLFVSPVTDMLLLSSMRGCGVRDPATKRGRSYWVRKLAWLNDNLFVACILANGSAALLSRLGEPLAISTHGCSLDMGPAYFLPLHPLISVQGDEKPGRQDDGEFQPSPVEEGDSLEQIFSVSSHPTLPILVFSDGYMVTFLQLPGDLNTFVFMRNLVLESSTYLKQVGHSQDLDLTVANAYNLPGAEERVKSSPRRPKAAAHGNQPFSFEEVDGALNETVDSEVNTLLGPEAANIAKFGNIDGISSGKIVFGEPDLLQTVLDSSTLRDSEDGLMRAVVQAKHAMLQVWKVAASTSEPWTASVDGVVKRLMDNLVRLFAVILDCPPVSEALERQQQSRPTPAVQTASLYQVICLYRHLLEVAQFDALQQHLAPSILHLAHVTMTTVLESRALQTTDPRLKTLSGCFTLLKFTEKTLNSLYVLLPKSLISGGDAGRQGLGDVFEPLPDALGGGKGARADHRHLGGLAFNTGQLVAKRLAGSWKVLYRAVLGYQQGATGELNAQRARQLLHLIQQSLQAVHASIPHAASLPVSKGDKLSLDGKHTMAMNAWKQQLKKYQDTGDDAHAGKLLHSLLYTHLLKADLVSAVELIDSLVVEASVSSALDAHPLTHTPPVQPSLMTFVTNTLRSQAFHEPDMVPCIRDRAIRQVVQTLARFMAAYFSNQTVYIFPPHNPQPLPAIHFPPAGINNRVIPKYHEEISAKVRQQKLSAVWTVERVLEYLLLSGLVCEAAWFADQMGNWKTAFQLATACYLHRLIAPGLYLKPRRPLLLPDELQPEEILHRKLSHLVGPSPSSQQGWVLIDDRTDMLQLSSTLEDVMVAGVMGRVEVAPRLLTLLVSRLKGVVRQFSPLVPADFYLPAPPLYCPQPAQSAKVGLTAAVQEETMLRCQAASLLQLVLVVMNAAHVSIPAFRWYIHQLAAAQPKANQFKTNMEGPCQNFPDILLEQLTMRSEFEKVKGDLSIHSVLVSFRDLCSLLWMLHARDNLSLSLRKREKFLGHLDYNSQEKSQWEGQRQSEWLSLCWACLRWAAHLLPFTHFLTDEASVHKVLVSMLLELAPSIQVADLMAEFFHDSDNMHPELQDRLDKVMAQWQSVIVKPDDDGRSVRTSQDSFDGRKSVTFHGASPRGESLSVYFLKQQQVARKVLKKRQRCFGHYEEFVFAEGVEPPKRLYVGARPFETKISFFDFLDMFCSVSFSKVLEKAEMKDKASSLPLINSLCTDLVAQEMTYFVENVAAQAHKRQGLLILARSHAGSRDDLSSLSQQPTASRSRRTGLFRDKSVMEQSPERYHAAVTREDGGMNSRVDVPSPRSDGGQNWQLTVNFGKKYTRLQQLVEWLEVWSNKRHNLGLGNKEAALHLKPSMKLQIPAQLIVLSLWLLENKYSSSAPQSRGRTSARGGQKSGRLSGSLSPLGVTRGGNKRVSPGRGRGRSRSASGSPGPRGLRSASGSPVQRRDVMVEGSPVAGLEMSLPQSTLREAQEVRTAYEQVLDGPDDSSSLVVSSLASDELPDELQRTSNAIRSGSPNRGDNSALNHTVYMGRSQSPFDRPQNPSPAPRSVTPPSRGQSPLHRSASASSVRSPPFPSPRGRRGQVNGSVASDDQVLAGGEGGLAQLLQQVIRKEMKRIVQIQQHSLSAMLGAIDDGDNSPVPIAAADRNHSSVPPGRRRNNSVRSALSELHNLQQQGSPVHRVSSPDQQSSIEQEAVVKTTAGPLHLSHLAGSPARSRSAGDENQPPSEPAGIPQFLRMAAEREEDGFRLPLIPPPRAAWGGASHLQAGDSAPGPAPFPLLRLSAGPPQPGVYAGSQFGPRFPPPPPAYTPGGLSLVPPPPPPPQPHLPQAASQPRPLSFQHVAPQVSAPQQEALTQSGGLIGIPLLRLPSAGFTQTSQESLFGRMVPPEYLASQMKEKEHQEATRQRHLEGFHQQLKAQQESVAMETRQQAAQSGDSKPVRPAIRRQEARKTALRPKPPKPKTPTPSQSTETEEAEAEGRGGDTESGDTDRDQLPPELQAMEDSTIHDGYAIQPGVFEGYEHLEGELGVQVDSETRFQYKMAQAMRRQLELEKDRWLQQRKVDFATNTRNVTDAGVDVQRSFESIRTAEAATAIHRDTGVDPIHEAITEYNRSRQGVAVPPDVYLGLRFADGEEVPEPSGPGRKGVGRAFLNVVDVNASTVLRDIPEHDGTRKETEAETKPGSYLTRDASPNRMGELEDSLRAQLEPLPRRRHDAVTVGLFQRQTGEDDRLSVALLPRDSMGQSKTALVQRLRAMNDQMSAMDQMSRNIENEFHNSKMLLDTLQTMNDSYQAAPSYQEELEPQGTDPTRLSVEGPAPKASAGSPAQSLKVSARSKSARSPSPSLHSRKSEVSPRHESRASNLSGISDISDIIGEVLAEGGVDLAAAGLTQEEADKFAARARNKHRPRSPMTSYEELRSVVEAAERAEEAKRSPEAQRKQIHQWMAEKYTERQTSYLQHRSELKEKEVNPYKPASQVSIGTQALREWEEDRELRRHARERQALRHRISDAELLIGTAITDAIATRRDMAERSPPPSPRARSLSTSPGRSVGGRRASRSPQRRDAQPALRRASRRDTTRHVTSARPADMDRTFNVSVSPPKGILKTTQSRSDVQRSVSASETILVQPAVTSSDFDMTGESSLDLRSYAQAMQDLDSSEDISAVPPRREHRPRHQHEPIAEEPHKVIKPKPFTELVRMQRPQVTRGRPAQEPDEKFVQEVMAEKAAQREKAAEARASARDKPLSQRSRAEDSVRRAYAPLPKPSTPRRVKTYAERLKELRPRRNYATPIIPRQHFQESVSSARTMTSGPATQRRPTGPPHKPMTYVQQLKKINREATASKQTGTRSSRSAAPKTRMPPRSAPHKPKTYTQQLKELNAPFKKTPKTFRSSARAPSSLGSSRPRPYGDPYSEDAASVLSDWSMDDDVRRLIYDNDDTTTYDAYTLDGTDASVSMERLAFAPSEAGGSDYYDAVMAGSDLDLAFDYRESVDVSELERIAEEASIGSGSILSVIDWDAVDQLIAEA